jgi:hypothetical protein
LSWGWDNNGSPVPQTISQQPPNLSKINIRGPGEIPQFIDQKNVNESHKTLGVFKSICGNDDDNLRALENKSDTIIARLRCGQLNRRQARMAYNCNYLPAMLYSLPAVCLNEKKLSKIQRRVIGKFLQIFGFEEKFPRAVVFGSMLHGGLGLRKLFSDGMCIKVESLLCHINFLSSLGKSMRTNITWIHIILGVGTPLLESDQFIQCIQDNWFLNIRDFLLQIKAKIIIRGLWQPSLARVDDVFIMEMVDKLQLPNRIVIIVNNWRIYFQILSLADITNAAGTRLLPAIFEKNKINEWQSTSRLKWPHQKRPPLKTFCIWKRIIRKITGCDVVGNLRTNQLGDWLPTYFKDRRFRYLVHNNHE